MKVAIRRLTLALLVVMVAATPVLANSSFWQFTMFQRYVSGQSNGIYHQLNAGNLSNSGQIWVISWDSWATPDIASVKIEVWKDEAFFDEKKCSLTVTPFDNGNGKQFSKNCNTNVPNGQYFIVGWKSYDDGRNIGAQGDVVTS